MTSASFDFAPLLPAGLPAPAAKWTGLAKYSFADITGLELTVGGNYVIRGRNVGQATNLFASVYYILDFSKIESGKMELEEKDFNLRTCIEEVFDVRTPTPGVVAIDEFVVTEQPQVDVLVRIATAVSSVVIPKISTPTGVTLAGVSRKCVGPPKIEVPFVCAVPLAWRRRLLDDFFVFAGIALSPRPG